MVWRSKRRRQRKRCHAIACNGALVSPRLAVLVLVAWAESKKNNKYLQATEVRPAEYHEVEEFHHGDDDGTPVNVASPASTKKMLSPASVVPIDDDNDY